MPTINYLHIKTTIDNSYAVTQVRQEFENPYEHAIDTTFMFRIPEKAFISNFTITIGNETYYAKITPKEEAEEMYEKAVSEGKDAALLEARDKTLFSYSVSLSANQTYIVELKYEQYLEKTLGIYEYSLMPVAVDLSQKIKDFRIETQINSREAITTLETHNYNSTIEWDSSNKAIIKYSEKDAMPKDEFLLEYKTEAPPVNGRMLAYNDGEENFFFHVFSPQKSDLGGKQLDKKIIFVLDKSGSMSGTKIKQLKDSFAQIIGELPSNDAFNIILFDNTISNYKNELLFATESNKNNASDFIKNIGAGGSTNLNDGLEDALKMFKNPDEKVPIVVMLTDGMANAGQYTTPPTIRENILKKNNVQASIFSLGFGFNVDFDFLKALSLENYGYGLRIYEDEDAGEQITNFYETISTPLLKEITFDYTSSREVYPERVRYLFEGSEIVASGKYEETNSITANVTALSREGSKSFKEEFELELSENYSFIPRFWAYSKIKHLLDEIAVNGEDNETVSQIVEIALKYGFVTPYTSLLIEIDILESEDESSPGLYKSGNSHDDRDLCCGCCEEDEGFFLGSPDVAGFTILWLLGLLILVPIAILAITKVRRKRR